MAEKYSVPSMFFHWITAILVIALFVIGWGMVDLPRGPERSANFALHKSLGLTVFAISVARIVWRFLKGAPTYPASIAKWKVRVARTVHALFYIALVLQPLSGYLSSSYSGYKTRWFGIPLPHWGHRDLPLNEFFTEIHVVCSVILCGLILLHVMGAVSHLVARDGLFSRMIPIGTNDTRQR